MNFHQKILTVVFVLSLPSRSASTGERVPCFSLWGNVADFTNKCSHWSLRTGVSIPALQEFTICFSLMIEVQVSSTWTAFMYSHSELQFSELGLGGYLNQLVVRLFGMEWYTPNIYLAKSQWYSLCLTWTRTRDKPALYIDGKPVDIIPVYKKLAASSVGPSCDKLGPNGTLTLGAAHLLVDGSVQIIPLSTLSGKLSLFRLWGREHSQEEVTSLRCTEGDLVRWNMDDWDTQICHPLPDSSLHCEWSIYEVRVMFAISRKDGKNTELSTATEITHHWLRKVLPSSFSLDRVSVFEIRYSIENSLEEKTNEEGQVRWSPHINRFSCVAHVSVEPSLDVADVQNRIFMDLASPYSHPSGLFTLVTEEHSIDVIPVESFPAATSDPTEEVTHPSPVTTATFQTSASTITTINTTTSPSTSSATASTITTIDTTTSPSTSSATASTITTIDTTTSPSTSAATASTITTSCANISYLYFQVKVNVSLTGDSDAQQVLSTWLNSVLPNDTMTVLDLHLLPKNITYQSHYPNLLSNLLTSDAPIIYSISRESCVFQVQVMMSLSDTQEMEEKIRYLLLMPYSNGSVSIETKDIQISRILVLSCNAETEETRKGLFEWPFTPGGENATQPCPKNPNQNATRHCKLCLNTRWLASDLDACSLVVETIPDLDHVEVTAENAVEVVEMIELLLDDHSKLSYEELETVLNKLTDVVDLNVVTPILCQSLINIISDIFVSDSNLSPFTNIILNITEKVGDSMVGYQESFTLVAPAIAVSVVDVVPGEFDSLTFGVSSNNEGIMPEIFINRYPSNNTVAFISLPSVLQHSFPECSLNQSLARVTFQFYGIPALFRSSQEGQTLNSFVVSASVTNVSFPIKDLDEDVKVTFHHLFSNPLEKDVECVYWNFNKNDGLGGWDNYGCRTYNSTSDYTTCLCDHLTHFGVLLDVSRTQVDSANEQILTIITYVGCGVSSLFLGITVLTYTAFEKLRRDYPSQILINLSLALLGLNLVFLVNSWLSSWGLHGLCVAVASMLHYFLLASYTWMGLEAVHMYFALVKVFNVYVPSYILKFCAAGWGIPLVICVLVLIVNKEAYGSYLDVDTQSSLGPLDNSDNFCWLQDDVTFYVSVVAYAVLVFLLNTVVFVVVLIQIRHMRVNSPAGSHSGLMNDLKGVTSLTLLLGLTWTVGFFTFGPARMVLLYLFSGLNSLQGLFIFLFHCLMKENVRKQWRIHLCFGRFRLEEYSEWSNSASVGGVTAKPRSDPPKALIPSVHSVKSSSTDSTSTSSDSDSSQRDSSIKRPNLGLFVNSLAVPQVQKSPSGTPALPCHEGISPTPGWRNHLLGQQEQR